MFWSQVIFRVAVVSVVPRDVLVDAHGLSAAVSGLQVDHHWKSPPSRVVKINVDAVVPTDDGVRFIYVARDQQGNVLATTCFRQGATVSVVVAEASLQLSLDFGFFHASFETNSLFLVNV